jgi:hypothetical protein
VTKKRKTSADRTSRGASALAAASAVRHVQFLRPFVASLFPPSVVLFVALFAWYLWAIVDLRLVFLNREVLFLWNLRYLTDFLGQPGSLMLWADHLVVQLCHEGWPAALVLAATAGLLLASTVSLMNVLGHGRVGGTWVIPATLLVAVFGDYRFPASATIGLALAIAAASLWCRSIKGNSPIFVDTKIGTVFLRLTLFIAVSACLYYVIGAAYYCFAVCAAIHEGLTKRRWLSAALFVAAAVGVKYGLEAATVWLDLASHNFPGVSPNRWKRPPSDWRVTLLYFYFPACALLVASGALWRRLWPTGMEGRLPKQDTKEARSSGNAGHRGRGATWTTAAGLARWSLGTILAMSLPVATAFYGCNAVDKTYREIDYCAENWLWRDVLAKAKTLPPQAYSRYVNHDVNLALYHTGNLPYQMLRYPQVYPPLLDMNDVPSKTDLLRKPFDLLLEMGRVNEAEHLALEMLETRPSGSVLKRLALAKLIKGQSAAAKVLLNVLRDDLVWGRWADEYLQRLAADPQLAGDDLIQHVRRLMIVKDDLPQTNGFLPNGGAFVNSRLWLLDLLKHNGENRMAFEYLMAIVLYNGDVQSAAQLFTFLDGLSYPTTPPIYEEAVLLYLAEHPEEGKTAGSDVIFRGRQISAATMERSRRLQAIGADSSRPDEETRAAVERELGDTYFYYFFYTARKRS